ncbi:MAG: dimeric alpha+beta barrel [Roseiarcus sp.]|uniref:dimeric alpha+beta barrel n=1 Tax=Roseiarcus sp. TaxID=1969460 RepID=UPI003BB07013
MKLLAIIDVAPDAPVEEIRRELGKELKGSWDLFAAGVLREAYLTDTPTRVVFILEAADMTDAEEQLDRLPLVAKGAVRVGLIELRPFTNWSRLFG